MSNYGLSETHFRHWGIYKKKQFSEKPSTNSDPEIFVRVDFSTACRSILGQSNNLGFSTSKTIPWGQIKVDTAIDAKDNSI
jgi:hypothetical protein